MDFFRFTNPNDPTKMEQGEFIDDRKSLMWIERYRDAGEFELVAYATSGIQNKLPRGALVSHLDSTDIMVVENHEINDSGKEKTTIKITGRSFETFLDHRIVGSNHPSPRLTGELVEYSIPWDISAKQALALIKDHILEDRLVDPDDAIHYVDVLTDITDSIPGIGHEYPRYLKRGSVYTRLLELLEVDDLGIKTIRPGPWSPSETDENTSLFIHIGKDRTKEVVFSHDSGEIENADYFWSNKKVKDSALVSGKWLDIRVNGSTSGYGRRVMFVDASDIDGKFSSAPGGWSRIAALQAMFVRGQEALAAQKEVSLINVNLSKGTKEAIFRRDYDVGDIITVSGEYGTELHRRVNEYVEIEDENGTSGYPTLTALKEDE